MQRIIVNGGCRHCARALSLPFADFRLVKVNRRTTMPDAVR